MKTFWTITLSVILSVGTTLIVVRKQIKAERINIAAQKMVLDDAILLEGRVSGLENHVFITERATVAALQNHKQVIDQLVIGHNKIVDRLQQIIDVEKPK